MRKCLSLFEAEGVAGLRDRSLRTHSRYRPMPPQEGCAGSASLASRSSAISAFHRPRSTGRSVAQGSSHRSPGARRTDARPSMCAPGEPIHIDFRELGRFEPAEPRSSHRREFLHLTIDGHFRNQVPPSGTPKLFEQTEPELRVLFMMKHHHGRVSGTLSLNLLNCTAPACKFGLAS